MASLGHVAVGMAAGRLLARRSGNASRAGRAMLALSVVSMLPDADVIAFVFRIPYAAPFGHRGATHSAAAALLVGALVGATALARTLGASRLACAVTVALVMASHGLLDAMTDGGRGVALLMADDLRPLRLASSPDTGGPHRGALRLGARPDRGGDRGTDVSATFPLRLAAATSPRRQTSNAAAHRRLSSSAPPAGGSSPCGNRAR